MRSALFVIVIASALISPAIVAADIVTVTPEKMQGWTIATNKGGSGKITCGGPTIYETEKSFKASGGTDFGRGAFYAECDYTAFSGTGVTPSTVWLGVDTVAGKPLAGIALEQITRLSYYSYVSKDPIRPGPMPGWTWWAYPKEPISLQLTVESPDGKTRVQLWYRPWGPKARGDDSGQYCGIWQSQDCTNGLWYCVSPEADFQKWSDLVAVYGDYKLVPTSTTAYGQGGWKSAGWDKETGPSGSPECTATGMCLNFEVGARKRRASVLHEKKEFNWAGEAVGFRGCVDRFTIGIGGKDTTFDFEPSPSEQPPVVKTLEPKQELPEGALVKLQGKVVASKSAQFVIDTGSGKVTVHLPRKHAAQVGETWSAWGFLETLRFGPKPPPRMLWTDATHISKVGP